jgi:hypothetical protein
VSLLFNLSSCLRRTYEGDDLTRSAREARKRLPLNGLIYRLPHTNRYVLTAEGDGLRAAARFLTLAGSPGDGRSPGAVLSPHHAWHGPLPAQRYLATRRLLGALCVVSESAAFDNAKAFWIHTAKV